MPVRGVFAQADIGDDEQLFARLRTERLDAADGAPDDAVFRIRLAAPLVFMRGHAEEHRPADLADEHLVHDLLQPIDRITEYARHGGNFLLDIFPVDDENGINERARPHLRLGDKIAHGGRAPQPSQSLHDSSCKILSAIASAPGTAATSGVIPRT